MKEAPSDSSSPPKILDLSYDQINDIFDADDDLHRHKETSDLPVASATAAQFPSDGPRPGWPLPSIAAFAKYVLAGAAGVLLAVAVVWFAGSRADEPVTAHQMVVNPSPVPPEVAGASPQSPSATRPAANPGAERSPGQASRSATEANDPLAGASQAGSRDPATAQPVVHLQPTEAIESPAPTHTVLMPPREEVAPRGMEVATSALDERQLVARPPFRNIDAAARLQDPLVDLDVPDTSLGNFVRMIARLSTVPITIRPEALVNSKLSLGSDVTAQVADTTIGGALAAALSPLKLAFAVHGPNVIIDRRGALGGELRIAKHAVADLVDSSPGNAEDFLRLLRNVVAARSWSDHGGDGRAAFMNGELILNQSEQAHFEALYFFERLREARGLAPRSRYVAQLFPVDQTRRQLGEAMLSSALLLRTKQPTDFSDVVWQFSQRTGCQIVVDWQALVAEGWLPEAEVSLSGNARTLAAALDELLLPRGLTYRVIKADLLQITTLAAELKHADTEFYSVQDFLNRGAVPRTLIEQLKQHVGAGFFEPPAPGAAAFDASSQCLIVRLPQSKQPLVADFLASQR